MTIRYNLLPLLLAMFFSVGASAESPATIVRAKIGIQVQSGEDVLRARAVDQVKTGDLLRIYVAPEHTSHVYVVHSDGTSVSLLNTNEQQVDRSTLVLPDWGEHYEVDGKSRMEMLAIICSPKRLPEIAQISSSSVSFEKCDDVVNELVENSTIDLS